MKRWRCKGSVTTADREYMAGDVIELSDECAAQLIEADKLEAEPVTAKKSGGGSAGGGVVEMVSTSLPSAKSEPAKSAK